MHGGLQRCPQTSRAACTFAGHMSSTVALLLPQVQVVQQLQQVVVAPDLVPLAVQQVGLVVQVSSGMLSCQSIRCHLVVHSCC